MTKLHAAETMPAAELKPNDYAMSIPDQAGSHTSKMWETPDSITRLLLSFCCYERKPVDRL